MNTRKAALRAGAICLKVAIFIAIVLGIVYLGQTAFRYTHAVFSDAAYEEEPGRTIKVKIPEDVSGKRLAKVLEENGLIEDANIFLFQNIFLVKHRWRKLTLSTILRLKSFL